MLAKASIIAISLLLAACQTTQGANVSGAWLPHWDDPINQEFVAAGKVADALGLVDWAPVDPTMVGFFCGNGWAGACTFPLCERFLIIIGYPDDEDLRNHEMEHVGRAFLGGDWRRC